MSTGIPFIDNIVSGVNNAITTASNFVNNVISNSTNIVSNTQNQLGNVIQGITNGISGGVGGIVSTVTNTYQPPVTNYNPNTGGFFNSGNLPPPTIGVSIGTPGTNYSNYNPYQGGFFNSGNLPNTGYTSGNGFDMNALYNTVLGALGQLPNIIATIQNPYNSPYISQILNLVQQLYNSQSQTVSFVQQAISNMESNLYQSTSNVLNNVGINVGQWSNVLDAVVRDGMNAIGYSQQQSQAALLDMMNKGLTEQNNNIAMAMAGIQGIVNTFTGETNKAIDAITNSLTATGTKAGEGPKDLITSAIDSAGAELQRVLSETVKDALSNPNNFIHAFSTRVDQISNVIDNMKAGKYNTSTEFFNALFGNEPATSLARTLIILASVIPTMISAVNMAGEPALKAFGYLVNADSPTTMLGVNEIMELVHREVITLDDAKTMWHKLGYNDQMIYYMTQIADRYPDISTLTHMVWRGKLTMASYRTIINRSGFLPGSDDMYEEMTHTIPTPQDLTRIADKRIWGLNLPEKYGQYAELPQQYIDYMQMWGYDEQFMKWLWAAHWSLPSPQQIFEMFQRHEITHDDMEAYLALTDWLPFFRDKLLAISYNPLTRVDIRRMYSLGVLSETDLPARYEAVGFSPQDAQLMTQFTVKYSGDSEENELDKLRKKIVNQVESLFVRGKLTRDEALTRLAALGVDGQFAQLSLNYLVYEQTAESVKPKTETYKTKAINLVSTQYQKGHLSYDDAKNDLIAAGLSDNEASEELRFIDIERHALVNQELVSIYETRYVQKIDSQAQFIANLSQLGLNSGEIGQQVAEAEVKSQKRFKLPTEKQMVTWYQNEVVNQGQVIAYLEALGYPDTYIPIVLKGDYGIG